MQCITHSTGSQLTMAGILSLRHRSVRAYPLTLPSKAFLSHPWPLLPHMHGARPPRRSLAQFVYLPAVTHTRLLTHNDPAIGSTSCAAATKKDESAVRN